MAQTTLVEKFDKALERLGDVASDAADADMDAQAATITEYLEKLRDEVDFTIEEDEDEGND